MATHTYLASAVLMGLFLLAIVVATGRARDWHQYTPAGAGAGDVAASVSRTAKNPATWTLLFLLAVALVGAGVVLLFTGEAPAWAATVAIALLAVAAGGSLLFFLFYGSYEWARSHGFGKPMAIMIAAWVIGLIVLVAISGKIMGLF